MKGIFHFFKSTILGGLVVLLPLFALVGMVGWAGGIAVKAIVPVFEWLPNTSVGGVSTTLMLAVGVLIGLCFLAGLLAETAMLRGLGDRAERLALMIPGYALMKDVGTSFVGIEGKNPVKTVVVRLEATCQLGFLMDTLKDGRHVVFFPGVPRALVGTMHIVDADRVQLLEMPVATALDTLGRLGVGMRDCWPAGPGAPARTS
ncbi:MAG: DUF502 domain-containing protein [Gemmataceae bacterium]|nr:DUF502 domain-containing protein [Gemmataceae bacterium]